MRGRRSARCSAKNQPKPWSVGVVMELKCMLVIHRKQPSHLVTSLNSSVSYAIQEKIYMFCEFNHWSRGAPLATGCLKFQLATYHNHSKPIITIHNVSDERTDYEIAENRTRDPSLVVIQYATALKNLAVKNVRLGLTEMENFLGKHLRWTRGGNNN